MSSVHHESGVDSSLATEAAHEYGDASGTIGAW